MVTEWSLRRRVTVVVVVGLLTLLGLVVLHLTGVAPVRHQVAPSSPARPTTTIPAADRWIAWEIAAEACDIAAEFPAAGDAIEAAAVLIVLMKAEERWSNIQEDLIVSATRAELDRRCPALIDR